MNNRYPAPRSPKTTHLLQGKVSKLLVCSCLAAGFCLLQGAAFADVTVPAIISDHMVLEKAAKVPIWGKATPEESVAVTLGEVSAKTVAGADGRWKVALDLSAAKAGPFTLKIEGKNRITVNDVVVGEVWLASGQSNMAFLLEAAADGAGEVAGPANPMLRQFVVGRAEAAEPAEDCKGQWVIAGPETSGKFSAVAYFFSKRLQKELGVPVGVINSSVGGTPCEAWTSPQAIETVPHLKEAREKAFVALKAVSSGGKESAKKKNGRPKGEPSCLFNGMISPLIPYAINGVIWYQGEANAKRAWQYRFAFPMMIEDWRTQWKQTDLPFYFCQLANFDKEKLPDFAESTWAELRESQSQALKLPNTAQAVLIDIGEPGNLHPLNKKEVGNRLAAIALAKNYGRKIPFSGPVYKSMKIADGKIRIGFDHVEGGLVAKPLPAAVNMDSRTGVTAPLVRKSPDSELEGFAICGADHKWVWADAKIDGDAVVVSSAKISEPVAVRYGWADSPTCNLYNKAGLPASPFRTDDEPASTRDGLY